MNNTMNEQTTTLSKEYQGWNVSEEFCWKVWNYDSSLIRNIKEIIKLDIKKITDKCLKMKQI